MGKIEKTGSLKDHMFIMASGLLLTGFIIISFLGCGKEKTVEFDVNKLAAELKDNITYVDELNSLDLETAGMFIGFGDLNIDEAAIFEGSGGTAEEIIVLKTAEGENEKAKTILEQRVLEQKEAFEDYVPGELEKLSEAVIEVKGDYAVLSVSDEPDKAREIIKKYM